MHQRFLKNNKSKIFTFFFPIKKKGLLFFTVALFLVHLFLYLLLIFVTACFSFCFFTYFLFCSICYLFSTIILQSFVNNLVLNKSWPEELMIDFEFCIFGQMLIHNFFLWNTSIEPFYHCSISKQNLKL